ncbi:helix-turn-helix domain-containing protein [Membranihabitans marinus]|uniref:helix-turn-helix domain-containing protein n=1 Tax=Membranihabitans marinus TaxID=1227546 RepID=UPI001F46D657|nr:hypothetical protein [Membranihabitans marinus]
MGKIQEIYIKESLEDLNRIKSAQTTLKFEKRVLALIRIKRGDSGTRNQLANYLGVGKRTLEKWLSIYSSHGIEELTNIKPRRTSSKIITPEIHQGLEEKLKDTENPFLSYYDAQHWVEKEFGVSVNYHWLRKYMLTKFDTKILSSPTDSGNHADDQPDPSVKPKV